MNIINSYSWRDTAHRSNKLRKKNSSEAKQLAAYIKTKSKCTIHFGRL